MAAISFPPNIKDIHTQLSEQGFQCPSAPLCTTNISKATLAYDRVSVWNNPDHPSHNPQELIDAGTTPAAFSALAKSLLSNQGALSSMSTHIAGIPNAIPGQPGSLGTVNLVKNLGTTRMNKIFTDTMGTTIPSNPCGATNGIMGSVSGAADSLLQAAGGALTTIVGLLAQGIAAVLGALGGAIAAAISALDDASGGMLSMIANELAGLLGAAANAILFAQSLGLTDLYNDPCAKSILQKTAPPGLRSALDTAVGYL